ncbi:MAG: hypothetical protein H6981_09375 [Gammaproteobacteria bacterium]|nr:hypothetical protein [Gammaproteobacteria bacterium]MCP5136996.1 hypothetical protein [Gammaproteobacteria bacterium]
MRTFAGLSLMLVMVTARAETMQLTFMEQEQGIEPYQVRMLVNPEFLRIDDGPDAEGFLLLRRADGMVFSVVNENESVLDIPRRDIPATPPIAVNPLDEYTPDPNAPKVGGKAVVNYRQQFDGVTCFSAVIADDLLPDVRAALTELNLTLAGQQMQTIANFPKESITPCLLARLVYARQRFLTRGLPLAEWDENGYRRQLTDYRAVKDLPEDTFTVPARYEHFQIGEALPL